MKFSREIIHALIYHEYKNGSTVQECYDRILVTLGSQCQTIRNIRLWYSKFAAGGNQLQDMPRSGRPKSAVTLDNILRVQQMVEVDPRVTYEIIERELNIGTAQVHVIMHEHLRLKKVCARWVPHILTQEHIEKRLEFCHEMISKYGDLNRKRLIELVTSDETWIYHYEPESPSSAKEWVPKDHPPPVIVRREQSCRKLMYAFFVDLNGLVATVKLERGTRVNAEWYTKVCLEEFKKVVEERRPITGLRGIKLHIDNASPHTAHITTQYFKAKKIQHIKNPPNSPDLALCDFYLFSRLKKNYVESVSIATKRQRLKRQKSSKK